MVLWKLLPFLEFEIKPVAALHVVSTGRKKVNEEYLILREIE